jgi:hypothetical protein
MRGLKLWPPVPVTDLDLLKVAFADENGGGPCSKD